LDANINPKAKVTEEIKTYIIKNMLRFRLQSQTAKPTVTEASQIQSENQTSGPTPKIPVRSPQISTSEPAKCHPTAAAISPLTRKAASSPSRTSQRRLETSTPRLSSKSQKRQRYK